MATTDRWAKEGAAFEVTYDRRRDGKGANKPEADYVTLTRGQVERLLTEAGYEKESTHGQD